MYARAFCRLGYELLTILKYKKMKKRRFFYALLCITAICNLKAQTASDSAHVWNMPSTIINTLPVSVADSLSVSDKILSNVHRGCVSKMFSFEVVAERDYAVALQSASNLAILLMDSTFNVLDKNSGGYGTYDRCFLGNRLRPGTYHLLVSTNFDYGWEAVSPPITFALTIDTMSRASTLNSITYTPLNIGDTLSQIFADSTMMVMPGGNNIVCARGLSLQLQQDYCLRRSTHNSITTIILDSNYNIYPANRYEDFITPYSGMYYIVLYTNPLNIDVPLTFSCTATALTTSGDMPYANLALNTPLHDSLTSSCPLWKDALLHNRGDLCPSKGYRVEASAGKVLFVSLDSTTYDYAQLYLMDSSYNILANSSSKKISYFVKQPAPFYIVVTSEFGYRPYGSFIIEASEITPLTYYIDQTNGNDTADGLTTSTALATLDTALLRSNGIGTFYLMEDYNNTGGWNLTANHATISPYGKDIRLNASTSSHTLSLRFTNTITFGDTSGVYSFILDSCDTERALEIHSYNAKSVASIHNLRISNSQMYSLFQADSIALDNCTFSNDTMKYGIFDARAVTLHNTKIRQNSINDYFSGYRFDLKMFSLEGSRITGNSTASPLYFYSNNSQPITVILKSGHIGDNTITDPDWPEMLGNVSTSINGTDLGGIMLFKGSNMIMGQDFTFDTNNHIFIDKNATITLDGTPRAATVATISPFYYIDEEEFCSGMFEGRKILDGNSADVAASYRKFDLAQYDMRTWHLHSDGRIYPYQQQSITLAEDLNFKLFPNPVSDVLRIHTDGDEFSEIRITDMFGRKVFAAPLSGHSTCVNVTTLAKGLYIVQLLKGNIVAATKKIIKK